MKKAAAGCFAVACVLAVLLAVLVPLGSMRHERIRQQPPLTLQELERLAAKTASSVNAAHEQPEAPQKQTGLPRRLNQPSTDEHRREFFIAGRSKARRFLAGIGGGPLGGIADVVLAAAGWPEAGAIGRASANLTCGNWEEARTYWMELLRENQSEPVWQQRACAHLAWLENDPEMAARYMDMACSGGDIFSIVLCVELATKTGSTELAEYYTRLGRSISPDFDENFTTSDTEQPRFKLLYENLVLHE